jgi:hypothetical protein
MSLFFFPNHKHYPNNNPNHKPNQFIIPRFLSMSPATKVLVILRNPIDRAYSQYQMYLDPNEIIPNPERSVYSGLLFEDIVREEIAELKALGITVDSTYESFKTLFLSTRYNVQYILVSTV